jgi:putative addiction module component (TIGR02574 family)
MTKAELASILELSVAERLQLAQDIWDSNAADASSLPLTEAQRRMLDERLAALPCRSRSRFDVGSRPSPDS